KAPQTDPPPAVRRPDPGRDRLARDRPRDRQGVPQGRDLRLLRRRHHAQEKAPRQTEGGQEADEAGGPRRGPPGGVPRGLGAGRGIKGGCHGKKSPSRVAPRATERGRSGSSSSASAKSADRRPPRG